MSQVLCEEILSAFRFHILKVCFKQNCNITLSLYFTSLLIKHVSTNTVNNTKHSPLSHNFKNKCDISMPFTYFLNTLKVSFVAKRITAVTYSPQK